MAAHKSDDDDDDDDNDEDKDDDNDEADDDDADDDDDDVESKDEGTFSVCEREDKPHGDVSLTRGKERRRIFFSLSTDVIFRPCRDSARAWSTKKQKEIELHPHPLAFVVNECPLLLFSFASRSFEEEDLSTECRFS